MKKIIALCLMLLLTICLCACDSTPNDDSVVFYYPRVEYLYDDSSGMIGKETTVYSGQALSVEKILQYYLDGPDDAALHSPLTNQVQLMDVSLDENALVIRFSDTIADFFPTELTPSLAALAMTCFNVSDAEEVHICAENVLLYGQQRIVFTRNSILLWDSCIENATASQPTKSGE